MFMDSDDAVAENGLKPLIEALQADADLQYAYGKVSRVDESLSASPMTFPWGLCLPTPLRNSRLSLAYDGRNLQKVLS